jgi:hypothetical protein
MPHFFIFICWTKNFLTPKTINPKHHDFYTLAEETIHVESFSLFQIFWKKIPGKHKF